MKRRSLAAALSLLLLVQSFLGATVGATATDDVYGEESSVSEDVYGFASFDLGGVGAYTIPSAPTTGEISAACDSEGSISLCIEPVDATDKIVLGREQTYELRMKNTSGAPLYNLGIELALDDGLEVAGESAPDDEAVDSQYLMTAFWSDVKNLEPNETYTFEIDLRSTEAYRAPGADGPAEVAFGATLPFDVRLYASEDPRTIPGPSGAEDASASASRTLTVVPFLIVPSEPGKVAKGAGETSAEDDWDAFDMSFEIRNNTVHPTTFESLFSETDGSVQIQDMSPDGGERNVGWDHARNIRAFEWNDVVVPAYVDDASTPDETLEFEGAYFNRTMDPASGENQGLYLMDGSQAWGELAYISDTNGTRLSGAVPYLLDTAKDIVIGKSVTANTEEIGVGTELEYTLTVKTNQYYEVNDVVVAERIGDGQTFKEYGEMKTVTGSVYGWPDSPTLTPAPAKDGGTGETPFVWELGTVHPETIVTLKYKTTVDATWTGDHGAYGAGDPIVAGDVLDAEGDGAFAKVEGVTAVSGPVSDTDETEVSIGTPSIGEAITEVNSTPLGTPSRKELATVGDTVTFRITYDASKIDAKQNDVVIRDFLPLGTVPLQYHEDGTGLPKDANGDFLLSDYKKTIDGVDVVPIYDPEKNMLQWTLPNSLAAKTAFTIDIVAQVWSDEAHELKDKGDKNLVTLSYRNSPRIVESTRDSVDVEFIEPQLEVKRQVRHVGDTAWQNKIEVNSGDPVEVKLTIRNVGDSRAYGVALTETIPVDFKEGKITDTAPVGYVFDGTNKFTLNGPLAADDDLEIVYSAVIVDGIASGKEVEQQSDVVYSSRSDSKGLPYETGDGPVVTMTASVPTIALEKVHYGAGNALVADPGWSQPVRVGDWVVYKVSVDVPDDDVAADPVLEVAVPAQHTVDKVYDAYNFATNTFTERASGSYAVDGDAVTFTNLPVTPGADYVFYVRTIVDRVDESDGSETHRASARFRWDDPNGGTEKLRVNSNEVTVDAAVPKLTGTWYYDGPDADTDLDDVYDDASPVTLRQGEPVRMRFAVKNAGANPAYGFVPVVTAPLGFEITWVEKASNAVLSKPGSETLNRVATFQNEPTLTVGAESSFTVEVTMREVPGSGSSFTMSGSSGVYYSSEHTAAMGSAKAQERFDPVEDPAKLGVPDVTIDNTILKTTNSADPGWETSAVSKWVRPGDVVSYRLTVVVPKGTQAFDLRVGDAIGSFAMFDYIPGSGSIAWNQDDPIGIGWSDANYNASTGMLSVALGDSPAPGSVDSDDGTVEYQIRFRMRAKEDGSKPTGASSGSFGQLQQTFAPSSSATAYWNSVDGNAGSERNTAPAKTTSVEVKQPNISYTVVPVATFTEEQPTRAASFTITNAGKSPAIVPLFEVEVPDGFTASNVSHSGSGTGGDVVWTDLTVAAEASVTVSFDLTVTGTIGAAQTGLKLAASLEHYHSTEADPVAPSGEMHTKVYVLDTPARETALTVAEATLTAELVGNANGDLSAPVDVRPGEVLVYELTADVPGLPIYDAVLVPEGLTGQSVVAVEYKGTVVSLNDELDGYILGDLSADATVKIVTKVIAEATPATTSFDASLFYASVDGSGDARTAEADALTQTLTEPAVVVGVDVSDETLAMYGDDSTLTVVLRNTGASSAYSGVVTVELAHNGKFLFDPAEYGSGQFGAPSDISDENGVLTLTWNIAEVPVDAVGKPLVALTITTNGFVGDVLDIIGAVVEYDSLPGDFQARLGTMFTNTSLSPVVATAALNSAGILNAKTYIGSNDDGSVVVGGSHTLGAAADPSVEVTAGTDAAFEHELKNTGAGSDTYVLGLESTAPHDVTLFIEDDKVVEVGTAKRSGADWAWTPASGGANYFNEDGVPEVELGTGKAVVLKLAVHIEEDVPYGGPAETYTLTATAERTTDEAEATDEVVVTGVALDGWSGNVSYAQLGTWTMPGHPHGEALTLQAVTAVHVQAVDAIYALGGHTSDSIELYLANGGAGAGGAKQYVLDGYKLWRATHAVPNALAPGEYAATFKAYDKSDAGTRNVLQTDSAAADAVRAANNPFEVLEASVTIGFEASKTELTTPEETVAFTATATNASTASGAAHDATVNLSLPEGLALSSIEGAAGLPALGQSAAGNPGDSKVVWTIEELGVGEAVALTIVAKALPSAAISAPEPLVAIAELTSYYSLPNGQGKAYGPLDDEDDVSIRGSHALSAATIPSVELTAGQNAVFVHELKNTGAGRDTYALTLDSEASHEVTLSAGGVTVGTAKRNGAGWTWTPAEGAASYFDEDGVPEMELDAGEKVALTLAVHVKEDVPYGGPAETYRLTATGERTNAEAEAADAVLVKGVALEGWSGDTAYAALSGWKKPTYGRVDSVFLKAVSAVHASRVTVEVPIVVSNGDEESSRTLEVELKPANASTYMADGYKLWTGTTRLPTNVVASGAYEATFRALGQGGATLETDAPDGPRGLNNALAVETRLAIRGTITDAVTNEPIEGASVALIDETTKDVVAETVTKPDGTYAFEDAEVDYYELSVEKQAYAEARQRFYALPKPGETDVVVDAELSPYRIQLFANPSSILGDGISTTDLTAIITDADGNPLEGVEAKFSSPTGRGAFPGGVDSAVTNAEGIAKVPFRSEAVGGSASVRFPVLLEVDDDERNLHASTEIVITFEPGAVVGVVSEMVEDGEGPKTKRLIANAVVEVLNEDLNFYARFVTGPDGKYAVGIPVGDASYDVRITKPMDIGGVRRDVTFAQVANVGEIRGDAYETFPSDNAGGGLLLQRSPEGVTEPFPANVYREAEAYVIRADDPLGAQGVKIPVAVNEDGTFHVQGLAVGEYALYVTMQLEGKTMAVANGLLNVGENGEMNLATELVDPYGDVRDVETGKLIVGAKVELFYTDTMTPVSLPTLPGFEPFDNESPVQITDERGQYAWMVYPETNYTVVVTAPGYEKHASPNIRVDWEIVRYDVFLTPQRAAGWGGFPLLPPIAEGEEKPTDDIDLAIDVSADRRGYMEQTPIELTVDYVNRSSKPASGVRIELELPDYTTVVDAGGGDVSEAGDSIVWTIDALRGGRSGFRKVVLQAEAIDAQEQEIVAEASISAANPLVNVQDDESDVALMIFSNRYGYFEHQRYIIGYPDGEFKLNRNISRAEIATIFARILKLRSYVRDERIYSDVPEEQWYADAVEAVTRRGLFTGYADGTFRPDQPISRAELVVAIGRFLELADRPPVVVNFSDLTGHWAANLIENVRRNRIAGGYEDGSFQPDDYLVRSEAVLMINRMLYRGPLRGAEASYSDVTAEHWAFGDVEESTRSHEATRNPDGSETFVKEIETKLEF